MPTVVLAWRTFSRSLSGRNLSCLDIPSDRKNGDYGVAESQWAKDMRRETAAQTTYTQEQAVYAALAAEHQAEAAREAQWAAEEAAATRALAQQQLTQTQQSAEATRRHNFAMWRQTTANGGQYSDWLRAAQPLVEVFDQRWQEWTRAKAEDVKSVEESARAESIDRFSVRPKAVAKVRAKHIFHHYLSRLRIVRVLALIAGALFGLFWGLGELTNSWSDGYGWWGEVRDDWLRTAVVVCIALALYVVLEVTKLQSREKSILQASDTAAAWAATEVKSFSESLPRLWNADDDVEREAWSQLYRAGKTINSMPSDYFEYSSDMLGSVNLGIPAALNPSLIDARAIKTRELLARWTTSEA